MVRRALAVLLSLLLFAAPAQAGWLYAPSSTLTSLTNTWTALQTFTASPGINLNGTAPSFTLTDTTASAKSLTIAVDANLAQLRESAGAAGSLLVLDLANNYVGIGTTSPNTRLSVLGPTMAYTSNTTYPLEIGSSANTSKKLLLGYDATIDAGVIQGANLGVAFDRNVVINPNAGNVGIGTASPDRLFHPELANAVTAATSYVQRISHITSGTAAAGFGAGLEWELENASGTNKVVSTIETVFTDATNATEDADFVVKLMAAGAAAAEKLRVDSTGLLITQNATLMKSGVTLTDGAGVGVGTLTNAPAAGNPTKWIAVNDNGTTRYIPAW